MLRQQRMTNKNIINIQITVQKCMIKLYSINSEYTNTLCRSQWPRGLRRRSAAVRVLRLWVRIPPGAWMFVCCECCVLSDRGLCDELITRPEESYQLWGVVVCDPETSRMRKPWPALGQSTIGGGGIQILVPKYMNKPAHHCIWYSKASLGVLKLYVCVLV